MNTEAETLAGVKNAIPIAVPNVRIGSHVLSNSKGNIDPTSVGYQYLTDTLTEIRSGVLPQKFYTESISDFIPMDMGFAGYQSEIIQNVALQSAGGFASGFKKAGSDNTRLESVNSTITPIRMGTENWAKAVHWDLVEIREAANSGNWNIIESRMIALKTNWDLGVQAGAFLGFDGTDGLTGLLNNPEVVIDGVTIPKMISAMDETEFQTFVSKVMNAYVQNSEGTERRPDRFVIPLDDYLGFGAAVSKTLPTVTKLEYLEKLFKSQTSNGDFKIMPLLYNQKDNNKLEVSGKNRYALYTKNPQTMLMTIPVPFHMLEAGTADHYTWTQPGQGQVSGLMITRPKEVLYFDRP